MMITVALARTVHLPLISAVALTQPKSGVLVEEKISWDERLQADVIYLLNRNDGLPPAKKCRYGGFDTNFEDAPGFINNHRIRIATEGGIFIIPSCIDDGSISYLRDVLRNVIQTDMFAAQMMGFDFEEYNEGCSLKGYLEEYNKKSLRFSEFLL